MTKERSGSDDNEELKRINDELLKRRAAAKSEEMKTFGDDLAVIKTHLSKGQYDLARQMAESFRGSILFKEVISLFLERPETFPCNGCGNMIQGLAFKRESLSWMKPKLCEVCDQKDMQEEIDRKKRAFSHFADRHMDSILKAIGVEGILLNASYGGFPIEVEQTCKRSVIGKHGLYICGGVGRGKSWLSVALLKDIIKTMIIPDNIRSRVLTDINYFRQQYRIVYVPWLLMEIKSSYDSNSSQTELAIIEEYSGIPVLVLDDIGSERPTEWVREKLNMIIYFRNLRGLKTIYTSNYEPDGLQERLDERITSRILQQCEIILLSGPDRRRQ